MLASGEASTSTVVVTLARLPLYVSLIVLSLSSFTPVEGHERALLKDSVVELSQNNGAEEWNVWKSSRTSQTSPASSCTRAGFARCREVGWRRRTLSQDPHPTATSCRARQGRERSRVQYPPGSY